MLDILCLTVVICARILSSGCMSAPENGTIAHNNRQTYIKTKDYSPCKKSVAIYNPYVSWLSQLMDSIVSWEIAVVFCPLCILRLVLRWHSILILTSSSSSTPWPSCLSSSFSSSPSSFISHTDFRTDWHSFYIIWYYILLHRDPLVSLSLRWLIDA